MRLYEFSNFFVILVWFLGTFDKFVFASVLAIPPYDIFSPTAGNSDAPQLTSNPIGGTGMRFNDPNPKTVYDGFTKLSFANSPPRANAEYMEAAASTAVLSSSGGKPYISASLLAPCKESFDNCNIEALAVAPDGDAALRKSEYQDRYPIIRGRDSKPSKRRQAEFDIKNFIHHMNEYVPRHRQLFASQRWSKWLEFRAKFDRPTLEFHKFVLVCASTLNHVPRPEGDTTFTVRIPTGNEWYSQHVGAQIDSDIDVLKIFYKQKLIQEGDSSLMSPIDDPLAAAESSPLTISHSHSADALLSSPKGAPVDFTGTGLRKSLSSLEDSSAEQQPTKGGLKKPLNIDFQSLMSVTVPDWFSTTEVTPWGPVLIENPTTPIGKTRTATVLKIIPAPGTELPFGDPNNLVIKYQSDPFIRSHPLHSLMLDAWFLKELEDEGVSPKVYFLSPQFETPSDLKENESHKLNFRLGNNGDPDEWNKLFFGPYKDIRHDKKLQIHFTPSSSYSVSAVRYVIMEQVGISVHRLIHTSPKKRVNVGWALAFAATMTLNLKKIHDYGIVHGDVHAGNVCFGKGELNRYSNIYYIDFGRSYFVNDQWFSSKPINEKLKYFDPLLSHWEIEGYGPQQRDDMFRLLMVVSAMINGNSIYDYITMSAKESYIWKSRKNIFVTKHYNFGSDPSVPHAKVVMTGLLEVLNMVRNLGDVFAPIPHEIIANKFREISDMLLLPNVNRNSEVVSEGKVKKSVVGMSNEEHIESN